MLDRLRNLSWLSLCLPLTALPLLACGDDVKEGQDDVSSATGTETATTDSDSSDEIGDTATTTSDTTDATTTTDTTDGSTTDTTGDTTGDTFFFTDSATTETGGMEICTCAENTDLIYVLSDDAELWSFDPMTLQFNQISPALGCPNNSTFSMSVDRNGIAYVMFQNDDIYTIDVNNPNMCSDPGYQPGQMGFNKFGMGFVSNSQFDPCDKLYAHSWNGQGGFSEGQNAGRLGKLDPDTLIMEQIGFINYNGGELTGTGDGRLFAFAGNPAKLVEYDKSDASVINTEQLNMSLTNAFAFGFYGGDFYMFTEANGNPGVSKVTHYDYDDTKALTNVVNQAPIRIVGAGVSTCVPLAQ